MSFFKKIFGHSQEMIEPEKHSEINQTQENSELSIEEIFTMEFRKNGGKFLYCENLAELKNHFEDVLEENDWFETKAICYEPKLFGLLQENNLKFTDTTNPKFLFSSCENLIADDGSILLCSNQIKECKPQDLPPNIIIFATINQIVKDKTVAMRELQKRYKNGYPSNITSIKYFEKAKEEDFLHYGSVAKNLYLLLLEN